MSATSGKSKLFLESVKDRHTSHWDLDMLSWEELDAMLGEGGAGASADKPRQSDPTTGDEAESGD